MRFVDFEWGCFRDIALDAAYFRVPFPGCEASFALPPGMADTLLDAWRNEIAAVWPDLDESGAPGRPPLRRAAAVGVAVHVVAAAAHQRCATSTSGRTPARSPRISTALSHYWDQLAADAAVAGKSATAELGVAVAEALNKRFPDAPAALPVYPAFRTAA